MQLTEEVRNRSRRVSPVAHVSLLDADPDLGEWLDRERFARARPACRARVVRVEAGPLEPAGLNPAVWECSLGFLVLSGQLIERRSIAARQSADVLLPGDPCSLWSAGADYADLVAGTRWSVVEAGTLALLDHAFVARVAPWPEVIGALAARWRRRVHALTLRSAIGQLPKLEDRLHLILWSLADRVGVVRPDGLAVPIRITDRILGELVGARREPVSRALGSLRSRQLVERLKGGGFLLQGPPPLGPQPDESGLASPDAR